MRKNKIICLDNETTGLDIMDEILQKVGVGQQKEERRR